MLGIFIDINTIDFNNTDLPKILYYVRDKYESIDSVYVYGDIDETKAIEEYCSLNNIPHYIGFDYSFMNEILSKILQFDTFIIVSDDKEYISFSSYVLSQGMTCINIRQHDCDYANEYSEVILFEDIVNHRQDNKIDMLSYTKTLSKSIDSLNFNIKELQADIKISMDKNIYLYKQQENKINELTQCINSLRSDVDKILAFIKSHDAINLKDTHKDEEDIYDQEQLLFQDEEVKLFDDKERAIILYRISNSLIKLQLLEKYIKVESLFNALKENDLELLSLYNIGDLDDMLSFIHSLNIEIDAKGLIMFDFTLEANKLLAKFF